MNGRERIRHPGPAQARRVLSAHGRASSTRVRLRAGLTLIEAVAEAVDTVGCDSAMLILDGVMLAPCHYVMPDRSRDGSHAAWYSEPHEQPTARLHRATATVGYRDGARWLHCHAEWGDDGRPRMGHLLPDETIVAEEAEVVCHGFVGGRFEVEEDPETAFSIFHVRGGVDGDGDEIDALIAKVAPHQDIHRVVTALAERAGFKRASVFGIGSLIGAEFTDAPPMASPISEVLIRPGALVDGELHLPMSCVDPDGGRFAGTLLPGGAPVCVTFELMLVRLPEAGTAT